MVLSLILVIDSNILFSATIRSGTNADILLSNRVYLIAPERLFTEFRNNKELLLRKTHRSGRELVKFLEIVEEKVEVVPRSDFEPYLDEAEQLSTPNDFPFAALAKASDVPVWSNDKRFKAAMEKSGFAEVLNTREVLEKLGLKRAVSGKLK